MGGRPQRAGLDLEALTITSVAGSDVDDGRLSVVEAAARWAGEEPSLKPRCASPVVTTFLGVWSEGLRGPAKARRQELKRFVPRLAGSAAPELEGFRAWMVGDWLVRTCVPVLLDGTGQSDLRDRGGRLRDLASLASDDEGSEAVGLLREIEQVVRAHHRRLRPDGYLPPELRWGSATARLGVVAAWNVSVFEAGASDMLPPIGRQAQAIAERSMGLIAEPSARVEFASRSTTRPVLVPGSGVPGGSWANRVASERRRIGSHVYAAGIRAIDDATTGMIQSPEDLVDRLLRLTDRGEA